jgi:hypothetical protein
LTNFAAEKHAKRVDEEPFWAAGAPRRLRQRCGFFREHGRAQKQEQQCTRAGHGRKHDKKRRARLREKKEHAEIAKHIGELEDAPEDAHVAAANQPKSNITRK